MQGPVILISSYLQDIQFEHSQTSGDVAGCHPIVLPDVRQQDVSGSPRMIIGRGRWISRYIPMKWAASVSSALARQVPGADLRSTLTISSPRAPRSRHDRGEDSVPKYLKKLTRRPAPSWCVISPAGVASGGIERASLRRENSFAWWPRSSPGMKPHTAQGLSR